MSILDRYVAANILKGYVLVLLALLSLFALFALVGQLDQAKHSETIGDAAIHVALDLPRYAIELAPITALLGGLLGFGMLGRGNELVCMMTSGLRLSSLVWFVGKPALALTVACALISEFCVQPLEQLARQNHTAKSVTGPLRTSRDGFWSHDGEVLLHVRHLEEGNIPVSVEIYQFDANRRLARFLQAERADTSDASLWTLAAAHEKVFGNDVIERAAYETLPWRSFLSSRELESLVLPATALAPTSLYRYLRYLERSGQPVERVEFIFWQKVFAPLSVTVMALLAVPFGFALWRRNVAQQILAGVGTGVLLFLLERGAAALGTVAGTSPLVLAAVPPIVMTGLAAGLYWRMRQRGVLATTR